MTTSTLLGLPYIAAAQAQKHVTHNEAIRALDAIVQLAVLDRHLAAPPGTPAEGARYIVAAAASGAWAGRTNQIAAFQDGAWRFFAPVEGWTAWIADEDVLLAWSGTTWIAAGSGSGIVPIASGGTGATTAAAALANLGLPGLQRVEFTIADDNVATLAVGDLMGALLQFFGNSTAVPRGPVFVRGGQGLNQIASVAVTGAVGLYTTALTGTTGTDGQVNIGIAGTSGAHTLYFENRVGFTALVRAWILP